MVDLSHILSYDMFRPHKISYHLICYMLPHVFHRSQLSLIFSPRGTMLSSRLRGNLARLTLQNGEGSLATTAGKPAKDQSFFPPAMARCCYRLVLTFLLLVSRRGQLIAFLLCMPLTIVVSPSRPLNVLRVPPCNDAGGAVVTMMTWSCTAAKSGMAFAARGVAAAPALASATAEDGTHACEEATCLGC